MKKALKKLAILLSVVVLGTILAYSGIYARNGLQAQPGDKMTSAKWNELVSKVSGVFTDSNGNVGIGTNSPSAKLSVAGSIESISGGIKFPDGSIQTTAQTSKSKGLSINGTISTSTPSIFNATTISNNLFSSNPTDSNIVIQEEGNYYLVSNQYTCVGGAYNYAGTKIYLNGTEIAMGVSFPNACDSSSASIFSHLVPGDIVSAKCFHNSGLSTSCSFTLLKF